MPAATSPDDRAVVLLGDPSDPSRRGVEMARGTFESWQRAAWGKRTRKDLEHRSVAATMGRLTAVVTLENGDQVEVEPCQVRFLNKRSRLQYPNC